MPIDRKDMLMEAESKMNKLPQPKLAQKVDEGGAYISLRNNPGWKKLLEEYIEPKLKLDGLWAIEDDQLPIVRAKMRVLKELVDFVDKKVDDAVRAFEALQKNREETNGKR